MTKNNLAIFASGSGTNAENLIRHFKGNKKIEISAIFSNNKNAFVIQRAINHNIKYYIFSRPDFYESQKIFNLLKENEINYIILAGLFHLGFSLSDLIFVFILIFILNSLKIVDRRYRHNSPPFTRIL